MVRAPGEAPELMQVCADSSDPATRARECHALMEAANEYPEALLTLLTLNPFDSPALPPTIRCSPFYEWATKLAVSSLILKQWEQRLSGRCGGTG